MLLCYMVNFNFGKIIIWQHFLLVLVLFNKLCKAEFPDNFLLNPEIRFTKKYLRLWKKVRSFKFRTLLFSFKNALFVVNIFRPLKYHVNIENKIFAFSQII